MSSRTNIMLMGPRASNKTPLAKALLASSVKAYGLSSSLCVIDKLIESKDLQNYLQLDRKATPSELWHHFSLMAEQADQKNCPVLFNAYNLKRSHRMEALKNFAPYTQYPWELYHADVTVAEVADYWKQLGKPLSPSSYRSIEGMVRFTETPDLSEGFTRITRVDMHGKPRDGR